jgi:hypothetical protein
MTGMYFTSVSTLTLKRNQLLLENGGNKKCSHRQTARDTVHLYQSRVASCKWDSINYLLY